MSRRTATDLFRRTLPLRKYQIPHFNQLLGHVREHVAGRGEGTALGYEAPMGSGKTTTIKALASLLLCGDLRLVVVAAPLDAIVEQWAQPGSWRTEAGECLTLPTLHRDAPRATAADLRDPKWWATASGFYVTTRQAMCTKRGLDALAASRASLRRVLVVGDEGHHHGDGTLAGKFFEALRGRGAATLLVSGTPWHGTGSIFTPDTRVVRLSAAALSMCINDKTGHPFAPTQWQVERHLVPYKTSRVDLAVEPNKVASESVKRDRQYEQAMCRAAAEEWARLGCPRTVINVPWSAGWKQIIVAELQRVAQGVLGRPAVVVDLIGDLSGKARAEAQARLAADGAAMAYDHPARVDVVVSCARMNEGTDWPPCSHVFSIRIPCSPLLILQRWARASRDKRTIAGYPSQWVDAQTLVFFVPTLTGDAREDAWKQHREQAVLLAAYLADYQAASRWIDPRCFAAPGAAERHVAGRKQAKGVRLERAVGTGEDGDRRGGTAMDRSRAVAEIVERIRRHGPDGTMKIAELDAALAKSLPDVSGPARKAALLSLYRTGEVADAVDAALARADRAVAQGQSALRVREELQVDLDAIIEKFGHFDVSIPGDLSKCVAKFTALEAEDVAEYARQSGAGVPPWDHIRHDRTALEAFVRERAKQRGSRPTNDSGACGSLAGFSWGSLNNVLRNLGSSLANALEHSPWYLIRDDREALEKYAKTQAEKRRSRPTKLSGKCTSLEGWTWGALNYDLTRCNSSLSKALTQTISPYKQHARDLREWHEAHGRWPRKSNGDAIEKTLGARWADMRRRAPEYLVNEGIPLAIDFSAIVRQGIGKRQYAALAEVVTLLSVQWRQSNPALDGIMRNAAANKSGTRGLCKVADRCHVNGITRANAEIEADCWRFTLRGSTAPDPRPWADLLASGDHKRIECAERVAFLDWKDSRLRGGTRWTDPRVGKGPKCPPAVRRPWTPPATAEPTNGT